MKNNLQIKEIHNKEIWENFLSQTKEKTFLQSWNWGQFQKSLGNKIWRLGAYDEKNDLIGVSLVIKIKAKRGTFLFLPHGPLLKTQIKDLKDELLEVLLEKLKEIGKKEKADFIRIAPIFDKKEENIRIFKDLGFRPSPLHMHPEITWELDLKFPEEDLLMGMRKTTRYLIRQALKNEEIKISKSKDIKDLKKFYYLYKATVKRQHFVPFSFEYIKKEFESFVKDDQIIIFFGEYKREIVSSAIILFWQNIAFYHHGASLLKYPKIPVSYLLQWEVIREAKKRGCKKYNFWGIVDLKNKKHPWWGLSLFKMGFGGEKKEYVKTQDLILSQKYLINWMVEKLRKVKRRY